jgi:hypothetical protein
MKSTGAYSSVAVEINQKQSREEGQLVDKATTVTAC